MQEIIETYHLAAAGGQLALDEGHPARRRLFREHPELLARIIVEPIRVRRRGQTPQRLDHLPSLIVVHFRPMPPQRDAGDEHHVERLVDHRLEAVAPGVERRSAALLHRVDERSVQRIDDGYRRRLGSVRRRPLGDKKYGERDAAQ